MSCKFNGKISAEFTPPKTWVLEKSLSFTVKGHGITSDDIALLQEVGANITKTGRVTCKKGMKTDLASVPRVVWNVIAPWDVARAAVIHDHLYAVLRKYYDKNCRTGDPGGFSKTKWVRARALSDKIFLLGMHAADPKVAGFKKYSAYWSVRSFGMFPASKKDAE
tara:strand:+ start:8246 stop:8740 length:495 start_codon:yes stop_codon:yes gene_type:complete